MCSPHLIIHSYFPACSHPSSVSVLTDTVLLHPGHLHDDSSIASGAYAKHKSTSGYIWTDMLWFNKFFKMTYFLHLLWSTGVEHISDEH